MSKHSAGILLYRRGGDLQVLIAHMGGPFWAKKDDGAWTIPKGEYEPGEDPLEAARREFAEELGQPLSTDELLPLGEVKQSGGKTVVAWAAEENLDPETVRSNTFTIEWPRGSGRMREFPEIDQAEWVDVDTARRKLVGSQAVLLDRLLDALDRTAQPMDPKRIVREGYDRIAAAYTADRADATDSGDLALLTEFADRLPSGALVLDAGCGGGVPAAWLASSGLRVVGLDLSAVQLAIAHRLAPAARFVQGDLAALPLSDASFDGVLCLYATIHVPRAEHPQVFMELRRVLRSHAPALISLGRTSSEGVEDFFDTPMFFSHDDAETGLALLQRSGFRVIGRWDVEDRLGPGSHPFVLAEAAG